MDLLSSIPFASDLGFTLRRLVDGEAEIDFAPQARHLNSFGVVHGGALMTLLDVTMVHAARSALPDGEGASTGAVTVEQKTSFLRPGEGPVLRCVSRVLHRTATLAFCEGSVLLDGDVLAAHATGTFKYMRAVAGRGRKIQGVQPPGG